MKQIVLKLVAVAALGALSLGGCGGGTATVASPSGPGTTAKIVSGVAATGAAMTGTVVLTDSSTPAKTMTTGIGAGGAFSFTVDGKTAPFLLTATSSDNSTALNSFAADSGTANINPLSHLIVLNAGGSSAPAITTLTTSKIATARSEVLTALQPVLAAYGLGTTVNPIADSYSIDSQLDRMIDALKVTVSNSGTVAINNQTGNSVLSASSVANLTAGNYTLSLANIPNQVNSPVTITTTSLTAGTVGLYYKVSLSSTGASSRSWTVTNGSLPAGLTLSSDGQISGLPTTPATATFTVKVVDSNDATRTATKTLSLTIAPQTPLDISTTSLPSAVKGAAYTATLQATGGSGHYLWSIDGLPNGLTLQVDNYGPVSNGGVVAAVVYSGAISGKIGGTPTTAGTYPLTVTVTDRLFTTMTATKNINIVIAAIAAPTISGMNPISGPVGTTVTITGTNFTSNTAVLFSDGSVVHVTTAPICPAYYGKYATVTSATATSLTVTVPTGAVSGSIRVIVTPPTAYNSSGALIIQCPVSAWSPMAFTVGTTTTIPTVPTTN